MDKEAEKQPVQKKQYRTKNQRAEDVKRKQELKALEERIEGLETEISDIESQLSIPEIAADYQKMSVLCQTLDDKKQELGELMDNWLLMQED